jgi:hypothetical protein
MPKDHLVWQAEHNKTEGSQPCIPVNIVRRRREMRSAVGFNHDACFFAKEVGDERADRMLASKLGTFELSSPQ